MLQAKSHNGALVILATLTRKEIEQLRSMESFVCPTCNGQVIIKAGRKVIPHFAHRTTKNCPAREHGEGPYHEKGKLLLYEWLNRQGLDVELEKYLKEIRQQPDLFVTINQKQIAIEFQCARISANEIKQRTNGYERAGITPIWILGANQFQRQSTNTIKITQFTKRFIHQFSSHCVPTLYYFCPNTNQFAFFQDIYFTSKSKAIGNLQFFPLHQVTFKSFFQYKSLSKNRLYQLWTGEKETFRLTHPRHVFGQEKTWYRWLYERRTHRELLPSIIYLPVSKQMQMNSALWNWQSRLCIDFIARRPVGSLFTVNNCEQFLQSHILNNDNFPLMKPMNDAILEYLHLLEQLYIIKQTEPNEFIKVNSIKFHKHIEDAVKSDKLLMSELIQLDESKSEHNGVNVRYTK